MSQYAVVEFIGEETVETVHCTWIESIGEQKFCYWPKSGAHIRAKRGEYPDKRRWQRYEIRVFQYVDDFQRASQLAKRAEDTSNLEEGDEEELAMPSRRKRLNPTHANEDCVEDENQKRARPQGAKAVKHNPPTVTSTPTSTPTDDVDVSTFHSIPISPISSNPRNQMSSEDYNAKLELVLENQREIMIMLRRIAFQSGVDEDDEDLLHDVLNAPVEDTEGMTNLCLKITENKKCRKQLLRFLTCLGGSNLAEMMRKMLRKIGTNALWANYSLRGRKGKKPFQDLSIFRVILRAAVKNFPKASLHDIEKCLIDTLKHAPHAKGGPQYRAPSETSQNKSPMADNWQQFIMGGSDSE